MIPLLITLIVIGVIFYFVEMIPMDPAFHTAIRVIAIIIALLVILQVFGISTGIPALK